MKLVTFNIRCDFGQDGENNFEYRKDLILKKIAQEKPDMICFQEVLPHIAKWLKENLTEYYVCLLYTSTNHKRYHWRACVCK